MIQRLLARAVRVVQDVGVDVAVEPADEEVVAAVAGAVTVRTLPQTPRND